MCQAQFLIPVFHSTFSLKPLIPWSPKIAASKLDSGTNIYVQSLLRFPKWGVYGCSKSPPHPVVPAPIGHNIDSCLTYTLTVSM